MIENNKNDEDHDECHFVFLRNNILSTFLNALKFSYQHKRKSLVWN